MSSLSTEAANWHWVGLDGNEVAGDEWELVAGLSTGAIEATTLVWKSGWAEWAPANRVGELSTAIPSAKRAAPREPRQDALIVKPPARPGARRDEALPPPRPGFASKPKFSPPNPAPKPAPEQPAKARDTLPPSSFGVLGSNKAASPPPSPVRPALKRARMPMPTLGDEPLHHSATATLRPPNAVPPPPRAMPTAPLEAEPDSERIEVTATPMPSVIVAQVMQGEVEHFPSKPPPEPKSAGPAPGFVSPDPARSLESTLDVAGSPSKAARQLALIQKSRTTSPDLVHTEAAQRKSVRNAVRSSMASIVERARPAISVTGRALLALLVLAGVSGALAVMVIVLFMTRGQTGPSTAPLPTSSSSSQAPERGRGSCIAAQPAARLAAAIDRTVPINVATLANRKLGVGFGASKTLAAGLSIDPVQFDAAQIFEADGELGLRGVVPSFKGGASTFIVDRESPGVDATRTVDGDPRFTLGQSAAGFARALAGEAAPKVIWPGGGREKITEPRVAEMPDGGYAVTFRRGGQFGSVYAGWLAKDGSEKSDLFKVDSGAKFAGTPTVGINDRGALLAFAGRDTPTAAWRLLLAASAPLEAPTKAREFVPPDASSGGAISPAVAGLSAARWLLQWTEGASGNYRVRAQTLNHELQPIDPPILVSPKGANAGQGVLWVNGVHAISLFILTTAGRDELWGASFTCE